MTDLVSKLTRELSWAWKRFQDPLNQKSLKYRFSRRGQVPETKKSEDDGDKWEYKLGLNFKIVQCAWRDSLISDICFILLRPEGKIELKIELRTYSKIEICT